MKTEDYPAPEVKVIISPRRGPEGRRRGRALREHYMQKKSSNKARNTAIAVVSILVVIALILAFVFFFPGIRPDDDGDERNITPIANIDITNGMMVDAERVTVEVNEIVVFSALNSTDQDGTIERYQWDFGDGDTGEGVMVYHTYNLPDTYVVTLKIVDNKGKSATARSSIIVNEKPVAIIDLTQTKVKVNMPVLISGSNSNDPDYTGPGNGISRYKWDFGDGSTSTGMNTSHMYSQPGNYSITLTVWDFYGSWNSASTKIKAELRNFMVTWTIQNETALSRFGYTFENQTTEDSINITQNDLKMLRATFNWTDYLPVVNITDNSDEFQLSIISPSGQNIIKNSTTELIVIEFSGINKYDDYTLEAASMVEATEQANMKSPPSDKETGEWKFYITAVDCRGGIIRDEGFFNDQGNSWRLNVEYFYYTAEIIEI